jgi:hypothetical protein
VGLAQGTSGGLGPLRPLGPRHSHPESGHSSLHSVSGKAIGELLAYSSMNFLKRASSSLGGNILLWEVGFSAPLFLAFLFKSNSEGTLTFEWAIHIGLVAAVVGALVATCFRYFVALPLKKGRDFDRQQDKRRKKQPR